MDSHQTYDEKRTICLAKWAECHALRKTYRDMMYAWPRLAHEDVRAAADAWLLAMGVARQAGKQMRLAKERVEALKQIVAKYAEAEALGIPLYTEEGRDVKCAWCNSRFPDKKRADGEYVHADCE